MAYQHSQLARECSAVTTPSARLVLMILASAMHKDTHTCFWRWKTLLHYSKLSRSTLALALNEIEASGIVTREHRYRQSNIYVWHPDVAEQLRDPVTQEAEDRTEKAQAEANGWGMAEQNGESFGMVEPDDRAVFLGELRSLFRPQTDSTKPYEDQWLEFVADKNESEAMEILDWMLAENREQRLPEHFPNVLASERRSVRLDGIAALRDSWHAIIKAFARSQTVTQVCEEDEHVWDDYMLPEGPSHTVDRCAHCGKFRTKPAVNRWTAADDLEAEYMELIECSPCVYDPVLNEWK